VYWRRKRKVWRGDDKAVMCTGEGSVRFGEEMIRLSSVGPLPHPQYCVSTADYVRGSGLANDGSGIGRDLEENGHGLIVLMSRNWPEGPEKMTEILGIASVSAEVPNRLLPNASIDRYRHASLCDI